MNADVKVLEGLKIQGQVANAVHDSNMLMAIIFGGAPYSQELVNKVGDNGNSSFYAGVVMLTSRLYERRRRNMTIRFMDVDRLRLYLVLSILMILYLSVSQNGR